MILAAMGTGIVFASDFIASNTDGHWLVLASNPCPDFSTTVLQRFAILLDLFTQSSFQASGNASSSR
ncbi:hypothetical protein TIFTF001_004572 [Ficus carica]|uniref:Uncharacterized protein n=1 Tax=Ficus carica TaxID=3494 RepID=A0AA88A4Y4_FICCA|nr:hypothetical protein TIFTF001_004572 [Ficus carica]